MTAPTILNVYPSSGPTGGGELLRITGEGFTERVLVQLGEAQAVLTRSRTEAGRAIIDLNAPAHPEGLVDLTLVNLDALGAPIAGEQVTQPAAYRFLRPRLVQESNLTRLVRTLLQHLKRALLADTSIAVSVDYSDLSEGLEFIAMASLPSLVLSGPRMKESRFYSSNVPFEEVVPGAKGLELRRRKAAFTVDLSFTITAASESTIELLNLMAATAAFLNRHSKIAMLRDSKSPGLGEVAWEMAPDGDFRTNLRDASGVHSFSCGFVVRGFDVDEGQTLDVGKAVREMQLEAGELESK